MFNLILNTLLCCSFIFNFNTNIEYISIRKYFFQTNNIQIVYDSKYVDVDNYYLVKIKNSLKTITDNSHEMPAFAVSLHEETESRMKDGIWLIFKYDTAKIHNGLPFNELVIEVNSDYTGFNIIRKYNDRYDGRCFYLNLENNMSELYHTILNILNN